LACAAMLRRCCVSGHMEWRAQASVNPKAETVEELQGRRKALHLGMLKLLREDLALKAEADFADRASPDTIRGIKERIVGDLDALTKEHEQILADAYNDDTEYKRRMNEAIDGKAHALQKMGVYLESLAAAMGDVETIFRAPLTDFASKAAVLRLQTGITQFPWEAVVVERSADLDLGEWDADSVSAQARELVAGALRGNPNVRSVRMKGVRLDLSLGWSTTELTWGGDSGVKAPLATVSLLLRSCACLSKLDLR
jgi:hypothetical protein